MRYAGDEVEEALGYELRMWFSKREAQVKGIRIIS